MLPALEAVYLLRRATQLELAVMAGDQIAIMIDITTMI